MDLMPGLPSPLESPTLRDDLPRYPLALQLLRVTTATIPGESGGLSSSPSSLSYIIRTAAITTIGSSTLTTQPLPIAVLKGELLTFDDDGMTEPVEVEVAETADAGATLINIEAAPAQITSNAQATPSAGIGDVPPLYLYIASTQQLRTDTLAPRDREPCLVVDINRVGLAAGYYLGRLAGSYQGLPVYEVVSVSASGIAVPGPTGPQGPQGPAGPSGSPGSSSECLTSYDGPVDSNQNDFDPSGGLKSWLRLTRGTSGAFPANVDITGLAARADGCLILITNEGATGGGVNNKTITLKCSSTASSATNRILDESGGTLDYVIRSGTSVLLRYDVNLSRWHILDWTEASISRSGIVSLFNQSMGAGQKWFSDKVGIGTTSPLANSALDVRGYTYVYFAGAISFGGGNTPVSEATSGAILQYNAGVSPQISLSISATDYTASKLGGILILGSTQKFRLRHKTAISVGYGYYNDDTAVTEDGGTATTGGLTFKGGLYMGGSFASTITTSPAPRTVTTTGTLTSDTSLVLLRRMTVPVDQTLRFEPGQVTRINA